VEPEWTAGGRVENVAAVFVTNRECPFRCVFCDLWKHTTRQRAADAPASEQLGWALEKLPHAPHVKLYNSGSFFDPQAIPRSDWPRIAERVEGRETLIVECHPRWVDAHCAEFAAAIAPVKLQVAIGLETADPVLLPRLKASMTLEDFERAAHFLVDRGIDVRAFILLGAPGHRGAESVLWARRSVEYALSHGVECCSVIPVRPGNGIVEQLGRQGLYARPTLSELHAVIEHGLELTAKLGRGRIFADLWDAGDFIDCAKCGDRRVAAMRRMNLTQCSEPAPECRCVKAA